MLLKLLYLFVRLMDALVLAILEGESNALKIVSCYLYLGEQWCTFETCGAKVKRETKPKYMVKPIRSI